MLPELHFIFPFKKSENNSQFSISAQFKIFMIAQSFHKNLMEIFCSPFCLDLNVGKQNNYKEYREENCIGLQMWTVRKAWIGLLGCVLTGIAFPNSAQFRVWILSTISVNFYIPGKVPFYLVIFL